MERAGTRYRWRLLRAGPLLLDGGSMFGVIPRTIWTRSIRPDDRNRVALQHNCLLLEGIERDASLGRTRRVLIETGTGDKLPPKLRDIFGIGDRSVEPAVTEAGIEPGAIDDVVVSHLHFDHAGGLTRLCRARETPDWIASPGRGPTMESQAVRLTFPRATVHVQREEWEDALANRAVMTRTYYRDHLEPIAGRVRTWDSPRPFPAGHRAGRNDMPATGVASRLTEVVPGIRVLSVPGHTWGQQGVMFEDETGCTVVFTPDVMPTVHHVGAAYNLGYDVEPYTSMLTRHWLLEEAVRGEWLLVLDHEPGEPRQRVERDGSGWYRLTAAGG
jgi:glyoxylase-like metal-dependent hydrolase (beta-lactamase superfamily II)